MTEIALHATPDQKAIASYLGLNWNDPKTHAVIAVCQAYGLDPVLKHVIVIPKGGAYITRDGLLHIAHRSGQLDGIVLEEQGYDAEAKEHYAVVSVYRKDMRFPFKYRGRYPASGANRQYAPEMAVKAAESMALRRAFDIGGLPTADEQHQQPTRQVYTERLHPGDFSKTAAAQVAAVHETEVPGVVVDADGVLWEAEDTPDGAA